MTTKANRFAIVEMTDNKWSECGVGRDGYDTCSHIDALHPFSVSFTSSASRLLQVMMGFGPSPLDPARPKKSKGWQGQKIH